MAFRITIKEDDSYTTDVLKKSNRIKASIEVIGNDAYLKPIISIKSTFSSLTELNDKLSSIESYGNSKVSIFLEIVAYSSNGKETRSYEFIPVGESLPLLEKASAIGFMTPTYHGDAIFPYTEPGIKLDELSGTIELNLIEKSIFESIIRDDYNEDLPVIEYGTAVAKIDELTAEYNRIGAIIENYKKQTTTYLDFKELNDLTSKFSEKYSSILDEMILQLSKMTEIVLDNELVNLNVDSEISTRYKSMRSALNQLTDLKSVLISQNFIETPVKLP